MFSYRELSFLPEDRSVLQRFYNELYIKEFPDINERESLENMEHYLNNKAGASYKNNNYHIIIFLYKNKPIAGSISDYLAEASAGVIEFLVVAPTWRGKGIGKRLLKQTEEAIVSDAMRLGLKLKYLVAEINDPFKSNQYNEDLDAFSRTLVWDNWGYKKLDFPYLQPALSKDQQPVHHLLLIVKKIGSNKLDALPSFSVKKILYEYFSWAMSINHPEKCSEYLEMHQYLNRIPSINVTPLGKYIGFDKNLPLFIRQIKNTTDPDFDAIIEIYNEMFSGKLTSIDPSEFAIFLQEEKQNNQDSKGFFYHLWSIRYSSESAVEGMASFFTLPSAGFGGYITLARSLNKTGRMRLVLARMEKQMIKDHKKLLRGWYIECDPKIEDLFRKMGFLKIAITYRQPPLKENYPNLENAPVLCLMYKDFGCSFYQNKLTHTEFLIGLEWIYRVIYNINEPSQSLFYKDIIEQLAKMPENLLS